MKGAALFGLGVVVGFVLGGQEALIEWAAVGLLAWILLG